MYVHICNIYVFIYVYICNHENNVPYWLPWLDTYYVDLASVRFEYFVTWITYDNLCSVYIQNWGYDNFCHRNATVTKLWSHEHIYNITWITWQNFVGDVIDRNYDAITTISKYPYFKKAWRSSFCWHHQNYNHVY